ncbi:MAG: hypothetical protein A2017_17540 [Lentisphaerae bacterium GWF2_44_16]|nr:MAG: hypothetical protein A2017_17540 [Lentisphaerae bacterium GWF2_44_16]HAU65883.1 hypothetical protein [Candidatus Uhrbacteria bacterium]
MIDKVMMGTYIAKKRRSLGMTQIDLATKLHVSFQAVSKWERGLSLPDNATLNHVCKVLGINEGWHIFEMASSMSYQNLVDDVNARGITGQNYVNLGALVQSPDFSSKHAEEFTDPTVRTVLMKMIQMKKDIEDLSVLQVSHLLCRVVVDDMEMGDMQTQTVIIDDIPLCIYLSPSPYPTVIMTKLAKSIADTLTGVAFIANENPSTSDIQYSFACSDRLAASGFNCLYLRELSAIASMRRDIEAGTSGGGTFQHASLVGKKQYFRSNAVQETIKIMKHYIRQFKTDFLVTLSDQETIDHQEGKRS